MTTNWRNNAIPEDYKEFSKLFTWLGNGRFKNTFFNGFSVEPEFPIFWPQILNFPIAPSDVMIASYPKSGTTWTQQIVWLLMTQDFKGGQEIPIDIRVPYLEWPNPPIQRVLDDLAAKIPPRLMKTHLPAHFLPKDMCKGRLIHVFRNAKDAAVSFYHHHLAFGMGGADLTFEIFIKGFISGEVQYCPYGKMLGSFLDYEREGNPILLLRYEDMKKDRKQAIVKIADFLKVDLAENVINKIYEETSFEAMKANNATNYSWLENTGFKDSGTAFMRRGIVGDWKTHFTDPELLDEFEKHIEETVPPEMR